MLSVSLLGSAFAFPLHTHLFSAAPISLAWLASCPLLRLCVVRVGMCKTLLAV